MQTSNPARVPAPPSTIRYSSQDALAHCITCCVSTHAPTSCCMHRDLPTLCCAVLCLLYCADPTTPADWIHTALDHHAFPAGLLQQSVWAPGVRRNGWHATGQYRVRAPAQRAAAEAEGACIQRPGNMRQGQKQETVSVDALPLSLPHPAAAGGQHHSSWTEFACASALRLSPAGAAAAE